MIILTYIGIGILSAILGTLFVTQSGIPAYILYFSLTASLFMIFHPISNSLLKIKKMLEEQNQLLKGKDKTEKTEIKE